MKNNFRIAVTTSDKSMWTIEPFAYMFNTYWSANEEVDVICESVPQFPLPDNFLKYPVNIEDEDRWPISKWTNGLIKYLHSISEQYVIIMLDDYWVNRTVDVRGIETLYDYMRSRPNILRVDLTGDRLYAQGVVDNEAYGHYDIISAQGSQYQMSLMPGIWNKQLLLRFMMENWTPWEVEMAGTVSVNNNPEISVVGTRQWPVRIVNSIRQARECIDVTGIDQEHLKVIEKWFPKRSICGE